MTETRAALELLVASEVFLAWAKASPGDATKVRYEMAGVRRPRCSSKFGRAIQVLARQHPATPPVPSGSQPAAIWRQSGVFTRALSSFSGALRDPAKAAGFKWVAAHLDHTAYAGANEQEIPVFQRDGWTVVGWATFGQGSDPYEDGRRHAGIVKRLGLPGWIANGEAWAENEQAWKSSAWWDGWSDAGGTGPVALSCLSSTTGEYARPFDFGPWVARGCMVMPQVYGATIPQYTVDAMKGSFSRSVVPPELLAPTFDLIAGEGPFADYRTWKGPRSIWTGDDSKPSSWPRL
jgi:hypothetical protein